MCRTSSCCSGSSSSAGPLGLAAAVAVIAAVVSAEAALITDVLIALASAALGIGLVVTGYVAWRVRVLTRPARPASPARAVTAGQVGVLTAAPLRAIEAPDRLAAPASQAARSGVAR